MAFTPTVTPGTIMGPNDPVTIAKLNQGFNPTITVVGAASTSEIEDYAVTAVKQKLGAFAYIGTTAGSPTVYTLDAPAGQESALTDGLHISFKMHTTCGLNPTLNLDSTGAHLFTKFDGTALAAGDLILNQIVECRYSVVGAGHWQVLNQVPVVVSLPAAAIFIPTIGWGGNMGRLFARRNGAFPNSQVSFWHEGTILKHRTTGETIYALAANALIGDITVAGLGGLDTGAEAVSTWYYVWLFYDGTTQFLVLSTSASAPAVIAPYQYIGLIGSVYNDSGGNFFPFYQMNRKIWVSDRVIVTGGTGPGTGGGTLTLPVGTAPANLNTLIVKAGRTDAAIFNAHFGPDASGVGVQVGHAASTPALNSFMSCSTVEIPVNSNASIWWQTSDTGTTYRVCMCGYTF